MIIVTSTKEVLLSVQFVCLSVCLAGFLMKLGADMNHPNYSFSLTCRRSASSSSISTSVVEDTSPEAALGKKSEFASVDYISNRFYHTKPVQRVCLCCLPLSRQVWHGCDERSVCSCQRHPCSCPSPPPRSRSGGRWPSGGTP